jgi:uncharacterized membrane protein YdjX (TVP38/TMEM64 family)
MLRLRAASICAVWAGQGHISLSVSPTRMQPLSDAVRICIWSHGRGGRHLHSGLSDLASVHIIIVIATQHLMQSVPQPSLEQPSELLQRRKVANSNVLNLLRLAVLVVLVGGSVYLLLTHLHWFEDPRMVKREVLLWGVWGPTVYVLLFAVGPSFLVPGAVMTIAGGLAFGALWGSIWSMIGAYLGALVAFGAGRFLGRSFVERIISEKLHALSEKLTRNGFYVILYLRLVPIIPYNALNLLAGASPIGFRDYFWASIIGMIPGTILFAFLGDALWHPRSPRFLIAVGLILTCFVAGELFRRSRTIAVEI